MKSFFIGSRLPGRAFTMAIAGISCGLLAGCGVMSAGGPSVASVKRAAQPGAATPVHLLNLDMNLAKELLSRQTAHSFADSLGPVSPVGTQIGYGDTLSISIWESPPATLFGSVSSTPSRSLRDVSGGAASADIATGRSASFPDQLVNSDGTIVIPFAGRINAVGLTTQQLETEIVRRLRGKAHLPQAIVTFSHNATTTATVVGEVQRSGMVPLTAKGERVLDAMAMVGGASQPVNKITIQVTRGAQVETLPLETIIRDPRQNVMLAPGDVITAYYQPLSFTALGATGQNKEVPFEATGMSLAQALGRAGGLDDQKANPSGAFIFRFEDPAVLGIGNSSQQMMNSEGKIGVIYRINLRDPQSFFAAQSFQMKDKDILYVSLAPIADVQKFVNIISSSLFPIIAVESAFGQ